MLFLRQRTLSVGFVLLILGLSLGVANTAEAKRRIHIDFQKATADGFKWSGAGESSDGTVVQVVTCLNAARVTGNATQVTDFDFIFSADVKAASVKLKGTIDHKGRIVFNGQVAESSFGSVPVGTQVQLRARFIDNVGTVAGAIYMTVP